VRIEPVGTDQLVERDGLLLPSAEAPLTYDDVASFAILTSGDWEPRLLETSAGRPSGSRVTVVTPRRPQHSPAGPRPLAGPAVFETFMCPPERLPPIA
jgi:hypothetical protein